MKFQTLFITTILAIIAFTTPTTQAQTNTPPLRELKFQVTPTTNLFAHEIRITIGDAYFDSVTGIPICVLNIEAWNTNSGKIVTKDSHTFTAANTKTVANAPDPKQSVKNAAAAKLGMVEKP